MQLDDAIKERKSAKKFSSKKPDWRDVIECIDAARYAPRAGGHTAIKFIFVSDKEKINKIAEAAQQDFISQAHYVVVAFSTPRITINSFGKRGEIYIRQQAGAAIQNFLLKAEEKKLAACWVGHLVDEQIKREFRIPDAAFIEAVLPVGYEFEKTKPSKKTSMDGILYFDRFGKKRMRE